MHQARQQHHRAQLVLLDRLLSEVPHLDWYLEKQTLIVQREIGDQHPDMTITKEQRFEDKLLEQRVADTTLLYGLRPEQVVEWRKAFWWYMWDNYYGVLIT